MCVCVWFLAFFHYIKFTFQFNYKSKYMTSHRVCLKSYLEQTNSVFDMNRMFHWHTLIQPRRQKVCDRVFYGIFSDQKCFIFLHLLKIELNVLHVRANAVANTRTLCKFARVPSYIYPKLNVFIARVCAF